MGLPFPPVNGDDLVGDVRQFMEDFLKERDLEQFVVCHFSIKGVVEVGIGVRERSYITFPSGSD